MSVLQNLNRRNLPARSDEGEIAACPRPVLIVGIGNELRGDDAAGLLVARRLESMNLSEVRVWCGQGIVPELVSEMLDVSTVVVIDAAVGEFKSDGGSSSLRTHAMSIDDLVTLAAQLFHHYPRVWTLPVTAQEFSIGTSLSRECHQAIEDSVRLLVHVLTSPHRAESEDLRQ